MSAPLEFITPKFKRILSLWRLEIFTFVLAIATLGSMCAILMHYDDRRVSDWGIPINLSTLIAILTVILRTSLDFILAEIIGQAKWNYFVGNGRQGPPIRRLIETSRFNDASQSLFGAVKLIPTIVRYPSVLSAIMVMAASLGIGSFVQQAIQTQPCQFSTDSINSSLPISRNITREPEIRLPANIAAAVSSALAPDNKELGWPISVECPTGNCTFSNSIGGLYNTMGVCSSCVDTSPLVSSTNRTLSNEMGTRFEAYHNLPNGLSIWTFEEDLDSNISSNNKFSGFLVSSNREYLDPVGNLDLNGDLDWAGNLVSPEMRALSQWALANVTVLTPNWIPKSHGYTEYLAATCTLYPCLRTYNASVTMGKLDEVLTNTVPLAPDVETANDHYTRIMTELFLEAPSRFAGFQDRFIWDQQFWLFSPSNGTFLRAVQYPCLANNTIWTKHNTSSTIDTRNLLLLQADPGSSRARHVKLENITAPTECIYSIDVWTWWELMDSMASNIFNGTCSTSSSGAALDPVLDCLNSYWLSIFYSSTGIATSDIFDVFQSFTDRLSNKLRMGLLDHPEYIFGQAIQTTVCVDIDYKYLIFPAVLVLVTGMLLAWTILWNYQKQGCNTLWKTSILPFLFYSERFVVQNGEDMSAESTGSSRGATKEVLMDLSQMKNEAKQQAVRFGVFN